MEETKEFFVELSSYFLIDLDELFQYGVETFGLQQAKKYESEIWLLIENLPSTYLLFPECRYLITKSKMYRWIILESHNIIYRIKGKELQILRILHTKRSIKEIKSSRSTKIN